VVQDEATRAKIRDLYLDAWHDYVGHLLAGLIPFSPLASDEDRAAALAQRGAAEAMSGPDGFAETLNEVPVMLVICADLNVLAATDRDLDRYSIVGGASIYPFVWSVLLAARECGLVGVLTTIATRNEEEVRQVLAIPRTMQWLPSWRWLSDETTTSLSRRSVEEFTPSIASAARPLTLLVRRRSIKYLTRVLTQFPRTTANCGSHTINEQRCAHGRGLTVGRAMTRGSRRRGSVPGRMLPPRQESARAALPTGQSLQPVRRWMLRKYTIKNIAQGTERGNPFFVGRPLNVSRQLGIVEYVDQLEELSVRADSQQQKAVGRRNRTIRRDARMVIARR